MNWDVYFWGAIENLPYYYLNLAPYALIRNPSFTQWNAICGVSFLLTFGSKTSNFGISGFLPYFLLKYKLLCLGQEWQESHTMIVGMNVCKYLQLGQVLKTWSSDQKNKYWQ